MDSLAENRRPDPTPTKYPVPLDSDLLGGIPFLHSGADLVVHLGISQFAGMESAIVSIDPSSDDFYILARHGRPARFVR